MREEIIVPSSPYFSLDKLYRTVDFSGHKNLLVRPGITVTFYIDAPLRDVCDAIAGVMQAYIGAIPTGTLRSYLANDGYYKGLTSRQITKDFKTLRALPADFEGFALDYSEGLDGQVGTHDLCFMGITGDTASPTETNLLRMEFPEDVVGLDGDVSFVEFVTGVAQSVPFSTGHAGFAFKRSQSMERQSMELIALLLPRYLGFDPSDYWLTTKMRGMSAGPHWINLLGAELTERAGGAAAIRRALPAAEVRQLSNGTLIRAAKLPPVGDINYGAQDIGRLPEVGKFLKPLLPKRLEFAHSSIDAVAWLARFDALPARDWDNS